MLINPIVKQDEITEIVGEKGPPKHTQIFSRAQQVNTLFGMLCENMLTSQPVSTLYTEGTEYLGIKFVSVGSPG